MRCASLVMLAALLVGCVTHVTRPLDAKIAACLCAPYGVPPPTMLRGWVDSRNGDGVYHQETQTVVLSNAPQHDDMVLAHEVAHHVDTLLNGRHHRFWAHRYSWQDIRQDMEQRVKGCRT